MQETNKTDRRVDSKELERSNPFRADKSIRDSGKVRLGDSAPAVFGRP